MSSIQGSGGGKKTTKKVGVIRPGGTTKKAAIVKGPTTKNPAVTGKTTRRAPVVGTGQNRPVGSTTAGRAAVSGKRNKKFNFSPILGMILGIGLLYGAWKVYDYKETERLKAEAEIQKQLEAERLAKEEKERKEEEAARLKREAVEAAAKAERDRLEAQRLAKVKQEEDERKAREAEEARLAAEARKKQEELNRNTNAALDELAQKAEQAVKLMTKGDFEQAENLLRPPLNSPFLPKEEKDKYTAIADGAGLFAMSMITIKPGPRADADGMYHLTFNDGTKLTGKISSEALGRVTVLNDGGAGMTFESEKIIKREKISQEDLDKQNMKELLGLKAKAQTGEDWYDLGIRSLELGKKDIAIKCFNTGLEKDPKIAFNVRENKAMRLFASGAFDRSLGYNKSAKRKFDELLAKYPGTKAAVMAGGAIAAEETFLAQVTDAKQASAATGEAAVIHKELAAAKTELTEKDKHLKVANDLYDSGEDLEKKAQSGDLSRAETNKCYKEAVDKLRKAIVIYQEMMTKNPSPEVERKLVKATRKFYWCKKLQTLG